MSPKVPPKQCPKKQQKNNLRCCPRLARELVQQQGDLGQGRAAASALGFFQGLAQKHNLGWKGHVSTTAKVKPYNILMYNDVYI